VHAKQFIIIIIIIINCIQCYHCVFGDSVDDAAAVDMHPEKRMKAAYTAFEEKRLPILKEENPNLRLSQLKQLLKKEWNRSPDNPLNQRLPMQAS
jgi:Coiled-coil domain-containing protein 124 /Oxs1